MQIHYFVSNDTDDIDICNDAIGIVSIAVNKISIGNTDVNNSLSRLKKFYQPPTSTLFLDCIERKGDIKNYLLIQISCIENRKSVS